MAECERVIRSTRWSLDGLRQPGFAVEWRETQSDDDLPLGADREPDSSPLPGPLVD